MDSYKCHTFPPSCSQCPILKKIHAQNLANDMQANWTCKLVKNLQTLNKIKNKTLSELDGGA